MDRNRSTRCRSQRSTRRRAGRLPRGGRGSQLRTCRRTCRPLIAGSPPARGAWIATPSSARHVHFDAEGRRLPRGGRGSQLVCPRCLIAAIGPGVASREGGVDRNVRWRVMRSRQPQRSPPARGAWIATCSVHRDITRRPDAGRLPRGGRGSQLPMLVRPDGCRRKSPPARGRGSQHRFNRRSTVWQRTAVSPPARGRGSQQVTESPEDVLFFGRLPRGGRGSQPVLVTGPEDVLFFGRLPRGGRGSQHAQGRHHDRRSWSPPARGAWIATRRAQRAP